MTQSKTIQEEFRILNSFIKERFIGIREKGAQFTEKLDPSSHKNNTIIRKAQKLNEASIQNTDKGSLQAVMRKKFRQDFKTSFQSKRVAGTVGLITAIHGELNKYSQSLTMKLLLTDSYCERNRNHSGLKLIQELAEKNDMTRDEVLVALSDSKTANRFNLRPEELDTVQEFRKEMDTTPEIQGINKTIAGSKHKLVESTSLVEKELGTYTMSAGKDAPEKETWKETVGLLSVSIKANLPKEEKPREPNSLVNILDSFSQRMEVMAEEGCSHIEQIYSARK